MKELLITIFLVYSLNLSGQRLYLDENKAEIVDSTAGKFYIIPEYESNPPAFRETVYYITGEKESETRYLKSLGNEARAYAWYLVGQSVKFVKDGKSVEYYKNGKLKYEQNYLNGKLDGKRTRWYENGQLKSEVRDGKLYEWYEDGTLKSVIDYINNEYSGSVTTYWKNGVIKRKDQYTEGKFQNGTCFDSTGKEIPHFDLYIMPEYKGGYNQLLKTIISNTNYPSQSQNLGIEGRVIVRFLINENGEIKNIIILEGVNSEINKEAVRVIGTLKRFNPGYDDGVPAEVYYNSPLVFSLK